MAFLNKNVIRLSRLRSTSINQGPLGTACTRLSDLTQHRLLNYDPPRISMSHALICFSRL
jgi:hypothetical protein